MINKPFKVKNIHGVESIVIEVKLNKSKKVFMSLARKNFFNENYAIILFEAPNLIALWKNSPSNINKDLAHGNEKLWKSDYKYKYAIKGFAIGEKNPVPLADIYCGYTLIKTKHLFIFSFNKNIPFIDFTNGVTRTIWLLANGAKYIPVVCSLDKAKELNKSNIYQNIKIYPVKKWFK